jgi:NAD(P)-dependent dehydrogenase (short-subunit alcohol dehydrogenase family)
MMLGLPKPGLRLRRTQPSSGVNEDGRYTVATILTNSRLGAVVARIGLALAGREVLRRRKVIDLRGQVVLITGSSRGLGFALAQEFARQGARLVLCARKERELQEAARDVVALGAEVLAVPCDVADRDQVQRLVDRATDRFGRVDILVNNAGIIVMGPLRNQTTWDFERLMGIYFWGTYYPTMTVLPQMLGRKEGRIVNITSIGGRVSAPHLLSYSCGKFAMAGFSEGLHAELANKGIIVTTVVPGFMRTGSYVKQIFKGRYREEYAWFSVIGNLPILSTSANKAAKQIVQATQRGDTELVITFPAQILSRFHGLFPGTTVNIAALVGRIFPKPNGIGEDHHIGKESESPVSSSFLTALGQEAARTYHQYPEHDVDPG